ncbi:MAG: flippase-like domain-containing protein [Planctomycetes bacterium]|nr:flippase-like domain-containing protein [Planctomycetota bacterium]
MRRATVYAGREAALRPVAGLPGVLRAVLAAQRAGVEEVAVRAGALEARVRAALADPRVRTRLLWGGDPPGEAAPAQFLLDAGWVFEARSLQALARLEADGLAWRAGGLALLPGGAWPAPGAADLEEALAGRPAGTADLGGGLCRSAEPAAEAEAALFAALVAPADGLVDRWLNRPLSRPLARRLARTRVSPNQVTLAATALGLLAASLVATGRHGLVLSGALLFQLSAALDCVDGELARVRLQESRWGARLDLWGDNLVHLALFAALARAAGLGGGAWAPWASWLGLAAVGGATLSFAAVVAPGAPTSGAYPRLTRTLANRDFSVLVVAAALAGRLDLLLGLVAAGSVAFALALAALRAAHRLGTWRLARWTLLAVGLAILAALVVHAGPASLLAAVRRAGWPALALVLPYAAVYLADAEAWRWCIRAAGVHPAPRLGAVFAVRAAGEAVNHLTPLAYCGGEPLKGVLLARLGVDPARAMASVVSSRTVMNLAQVAFVAAGVGLAVRHGVGGGWVSASALAAAGVLAATGVLLAFQFRGPGKLALALARRLGRTGPWLERHATGLARFDEAVRRFYEAEPRPLACSFLWSTAGWVLGAGEVWLGLGLLGAPVGVAEALAMEAVIGVIKGAGFFVPASLGVQEGGTVLWLAAWGVAAPEATAFALLRRVRELAWLAVGLACLRGAPAARG